MIVLQTVAVAFAMFSAVPVPQFNWTEKNMRYAMCAFPLIGVVIGLLWFLCGVLPLPGAARAAGFCLIPVWVTGGIHLDGYADTCDALSSYGDREKKLEILKDSHIGAFAAIMLALYYMIDIAAISEIHTQKAVSAVAAVFFLARCFSGIAVMTLQPAKKEGLLYTFASSAQKVMVKAALYFQTVLCVVLMLLVSGWYGAAAIGAVLLSFFYFKKKSYKELGGITGDTAGFFVTVCEAAAAAAVAVTGYFL